MLQGYYDTMVSQICNRQNIDFLVFSLNLGDLMAYKFLNFPGQQRLYYLKSKFHE